MYLYSFPHKAIIKLMHFLIHSILGMKKLASNSRIKCCTLDQVHFELIDHSRKCKATLKTHRCIYWGLAFYDQFTMRCILFFVLEHLFRLISPLSQYNKPLRPTN